MPSPISHWAFYLGVGMGGYVPTVLATSWSQALLIAVTAMGVLRVGQAAWRNGPGILRERADASP